MLLSGSVLNGYAIRATDGVSGSVSDALFDDRTWKLCWLVVKIGTWLPGREVLIHPAALGTPDRAKRELPVALTQAEVKESPDAITDQPVSRQTEDGGLGTILGPSPTPHPGGIVTLDDAGLEIGSPTGDPHLRSIAETTGYLINATDGIIGHLENVLIEETDWSVRYLVIDTRNWWVGKHVLLAPRVVQEIDWSAEEIKVELTREDIRGSPPWTPGDIIDNSLEKRLRTHYGWPGDGV